jgi:hypothetical protein
MAVYFHNLYNKVTEGDEVGGADPGAGQAGSKGGAGAQRERAGSDEVEGAAQERALAERRQGEEGNEQQQGGANRGPGGGGGGGRKNGEPDLEEKFGRFEIKPPTRPGGSGGPSMNLTAGSEQGDETVSMVSDTW